MKTNEINYNLIKYEDEIEPKDVIADELDIIIFIGNYYESSYKQYKKGENYILALEICSKIKEGSLKVFHCPDKENNELESQKVLL